MELKSSMRVIGFSVIMMAAVVSFSGCEVFVDLGLKTSTFEMYDARLPNSDLNWSTLLLPGYKENDPSFRYLIHYYDNDRCTGSYYAADTLQYEVEGTWSLLEPDVMRLQLDDFVDGDFNITKLDKTTYLLETESNKHGLPIDPPTLPLKLYNRKVY